MAGYAGPSRAWLLLLLLGGPGGVQAEAGKWSLDVDSVSEGGVREGGTCVIKAFGLCPLGESEAPQLLLLHQNALQQQHHPPQT